MFEFKESISMADAMEKRISSKTTDSQEQPEVKDVVNVSQEAPVEDVVEPEAQVNEEVTEEAEESEEIKADETQEDHEELFVDYDGREISFKQIAEWEQGSLRQSDYTRKSQVNAEDRKAIDTEREQLNADRISINGNFD